MRIVIGKGGLGAESAAAFRELGGVYLAIVGGAAALETTWIEAIEDVDLDDLNPESLWQFRVRGFGPLRVAMDSRGGNLYAAVDAGAKANRAAALAALGVGRASAGERSRRVSGAIRSDRRVGRGSIRRSIAVARDDVMPERAPACTPTIAISSVREPLVDVLRQLGERRVLAEQARQRASRRTRVVALGHDRHVAGDRNRDQQRIEPPCAARPAT